jgi:hypothetical protein
MLGTLMIAAALAAPHVVESGQGLTRADGDRYAAWVHGTNVRVLDEKTQRTSSVPMPAECRTPDALGGGQLVFMCGDEQRELRMLDVAALTWSVVPSTDQVRSMFENAVTVDGVGSVWIATSVETVENRLLHPMWIERATGRVVADDPGDVTKYPNLDAPELWAPLCPPLRRLPSRTWTPEEPSGPRWIAPDVKGARALDTLGGRMLLRFCGTPKTRLVTRELIYSARSFSENRVTWTDTRWIGDGATVRESVRTLDVTTGRVRSWAFGDMPGLYVVHTRRHIFVDHERRADYARRYAIDLSQR